MIAGRPRRAAGWPPLAARPAGGRAREVVRLVRNAAVGHREQDAHAAGAAAVSGAVQRVAVTARVPPLLAQPWPRCCRTRRRGCRRSPGSAHRRCARSPCGPRHPSGLRSVTRPSRTGEPPCRSRSGSCRAGWARGSWQRGSSCRCRRTTRCRRRSCRSRPAARPHRERRPASHRPRSGTTDPARRTTARVPRPWLPHHHHHCRCRRSPAWAWAPASGRGARSPG